MKTILYLTLVCLFAFYSCGTNPTSEDNSNVIEIEEDKTEEANTYYTTIVKAHAYAELAINDVLAAVEKMDSENYNTVQLSAIKFLESIIATIEETECDKDFEDLKNITLETTKTYKRLILEDLYQKNELGLKFMDMTEEEASLYWELDVKITKEINNVNKKFTKIHDEFVEKYDIKI